MTAGLLLCHLRASASPSTTLLAAIASVAPPPSSSGRAAERRQPAQAGDRDVELDVVQAALEAEAEQRAQRLALAQAVEQPLRFARAAR